MSRLYLLRENRGFLMGIALIFLLVLAILGGALFMRTVHEHKFAGISMDELTARYAAERGIEYAIAELKRNAEFKTHHAQEGPAGVFTLTSNDLPSTTPLLTPVTIVDENYPNATENDLGSYASNFTNEDSRFITKTYADPRVPVEIVILSKGISNGQTYLLVTKYVPSSLYRFFIFSPFDFWPTWNTYDADEGKIHTNGNVIFSGGALISNLEELSTAKYFKYNVGYFVPLPGTKIATSTQGPIEKSPGSGEYYTWDDVFYTIRYPFIIPNPTDDPLYKYNNKADGWNYGSQNGLLWQHPNGTIYHLTETTYPSLPIGDKPENHILDPYSYANLGRYACDNRLSFCGNSELNYFHTGINGIKIPNWLDKSYTINKYAHLDGTTWKQYGNGWKYPAEDMTVYNFNSQYQKTKWQEFLETETGATTNTLAGVLKDTNTGGTHIEPLSITGADYKGKSQAKGIFIDWRNFGGLKVYIKGAVYTWTGNKIDINNVEGVFEQKSFTDPNSTETKNVIVLDIGKLKEALGSNAGLEQNIIYSTYPIVLTKAQDILDDGLTTVCEDNIYLRGNYNDKPATGGKTFKPSAAISARKIYTLSGSWHAWDDPPKTLPDTFHNPDYPNKWDFYCPTGPAYQGCRDTLISNGRKATETTNPAYENGYNWYADHYQNMAPAVPQDSDPTTPLDIDPYVYNVALVGYSGATPEVLERWWDYINPGDNTTPPSEELTNKQIAIRSIYGAQIYLEKTDFPGSGSWSGFNPRCCTVPGESGGFPPPCADCQKYTEFRSYPTYGPGGGYNNFFYNSQWENGEDVPPGDLVGYSSAVFLELEDNETNWTQHFNAISLPPQT